MLEGKHLTLRAIGRDDLPRYGTWLNDPEETSHLKAYVPFNLDGETDWYEAQPFTETNVNVRRNRSF